MSRRERHYSEYSPRIDVDEFEESIEFQFIEEDGKGNDVGYCPDPWGMHKHGDSTGKFAIHREKKVFNCWVCGGGTLLSLGMAVWDMSEDEAINKLLKMCGEPSDERFEDEIEQLLREDETKRHRNLPYFNEHVLDQHIANIRDEWASEFLHERGISDEVAERHKLGFDPAAKKWSASMGEYQGPGILFPHFWQGRLVGWQTRWLLDDRPKWVRKYNNTSDFPKEFTVYNYEAVYLAERELVLVESVPTALYLESIGYPAMATFGGSVNPEQIRLLRKCHQGIVIAPDNDEPGKKLIEKAKELDRFIPVRVCYPVGEEGSGADLADIPRAEAEETISDAEDIGVLFQ